jgi:1-acyl-sn-glycerol-3-phosphate acyltransferase
VAVATVGGNLYLFFGTLVCGLLAIAVSWIPPRGNLVYWVARLWSRGLLLCSGLSLEVRQQGDLESGMPYVFMSNHQSLFDIPALIASLPGQARFLAKRSLFRIPVFGWALRAGGFISIDREDRSRAGRSFSAAVARLRAGASAVVFPEGTRSLDGQLLPFQRGGFLLALKSGLPIVPVGIRGSLEVQPKGRRRVRPGRVTVCYGRPIATREYGIREREMLSSRVREQIEELRGALSDPRSEPETS